MEPERPHPPAVETPAEGVEPASLLAAPTYSPSKASAVLELDMDDGLILYDHDSSLVHHLNPSAAMVWHLCEGEATVAELAADIAEQYRMDPDTILAQVARLIAELDALGLVHDDQE